MNDNGVRLIGRRARVNFMLGGGDQPVKRGAVRAGVPTCRLFVQPVGSVADGVGADRAR